MKLSARNQFKGTIIEIQELQECLGYARWENFVVAIGRALDS